MAKETNLAKVKEIACELVMYPLIEVDSQLMIVMHPFINSAVISYRNSQEKNVVVNLIEDENALKDYQDILKKMINEAKDVDQIRSFINRPYRLYFLEKVAPHLSEYDYAKTLFNAYLYTEHPDKDPNMSKKKLVSLFNKAEKQHLMRKEEYEKFCVLDDVVTTYRGVNSKSQKAIKGLSWTTDIEVARWFATRFGENGIVYRAQIDKKNILAFFEGRQETEIVADPERLREIEVFEYRKKKDKDFEK